VSRRPALFLAAALYVATTASPEARAEEASTEEASTEACMAAHLDNQKLRRQGKLVAAREELLVCVQEGCPPPVRAECNDWLGELDAQMPTVVVAGTNEAGEDTVAVRVSIDGVVVGERLDGRPIALDPGAHTLLCEHQGKQKAADLVVVQGQKNRAVACDFTVSVPAPAPAPARVAPPEDPGQPIAAYVLGALGVGAFVSFAAFGIVGKNEADELDETCGEHAAPPNQNTCTEDEIDAVRNKLIAADVSLGVGAGLLGVAVALFIYHHLSAPDDPNAAWRLDLGPLGSSGAEGVAGQLTIRY
jgi:hypothetical protein